MMNAQVRERTGVRRCDGQRAERADEGWRPAGVPNDDEQDGAGHAKRAPCEPPREAEERGELARHAQPSDPPSGSRVDRRFDCREEREELDVGAARTADRVELPKDEGLREVGET